MGFNKNILDAVLVFWASQVTIVVKNMPANAGDASDVDLIPESGRSKQRARNSPV